MCSVCATIDPTAPPVMMIGPSAPNGPPVPMLIAAEIGLSTATRGCDPAAADEDRLDRLRHPVPADLLRTEPRHQPHRQATDDRGQKDQQRLWWPAPGAISRVLTRW